MLPDGNAEFTEKMGMLGDKEHTPLHPLLLLLPLTLLKFQTIILLHHSF
jgi:hypothetical protein